MLNAVFVCPSNTTLEEVVSFINSSKSAEPYSTSKNAKNIPFELIPIEPLKYQEFNFSTNSEKFFLMGKRDSKLIPMQISDTSNQRQQPKIQEKIKLFVLFHYPGGFDKTYIYEALLTGRIPKYSKLHPIELNKS